MSKSLILKYIEYFENSKVLTGRKLNIVLCILNHQNLKGGGIYGIDRIEERTRIHRSDIYRIIKKLSFIKRKKEGNTTVFYIDINEFEDFLSHNKQQFASGNLPSQESKEWENPTKGSGNLPPREVGKSHQEKWENPTKGSGNLPLQNPNQAKATQKPAEPRDSNIKTLNLDSNIKTLIIEEEEAGNPDSKTETENKKQKKENIENRDFASLICEKLIFEFRQAYAENFGFYPSIPKKHKEVFLEKLTEKTGGEREKIETVAKRLAPALSKYFRLNDPLAKKRSYDLLALAYNLDKLLTSAAGITRDTYDFKKSREQAIKRTLAAVL